MTKLEDIQPNAAPKGVLPTRMTQRDALSYFEHSRAHDTSAKMALQWVRSFQDVVETVSIQGRSAPWPYFSMFWVLLSDILLGLREWAEQQSKFGEGAITPQHAFYRVVQMQKSLVEATDVLKAALTEDELVYTDLMRQTCCHVHQKGFMVQFRKAEQPGLVTLKEKRQVPTVNRQIHLDDIMAAVDRVLEPANGQDGLVVAGLAPRLRPYAPALVAALEAIVNAASTPEEDAAFERLVDEVMARSVR